MTPEHFDYLRDRARELAASGGAEPAMSEYRRYRLTRSLLVQIINDIEKIQRMITDLKCHDKNGAVEPGPAEVPVDTFKWVMGPLNKRMRKKTAE